MSFRTLRIAATALCLGLTAPLAANAQTDAPALDDEAREAVVAKAAASLRERYVFPEVGEKAAAHIEDQSASGAYDALTATRVFAETLTRDLQEVTNDKHLRASTPRPPRKPGDRPARPTAEAGIVRADLLEGGVGYIELTGFDELAKFRPAIDKAMAALAQSSSVIIDLRRNGGGDPQSVAYLVSHFLEAGEPVHVNDFVTRIHGTTDEKVEEFWSSDTPTSMYGKPLYVLTSNYTFSAAEEFTYDVKVMDLGKSVGETTGGGANPGDTVELGHDIRLFVPDGRARNPLTGENWEGVGVPPDVPTEADNALRAALDALDHPEPAGEIETLSKSRVFTPAGEGGSTDRR